MSYFHKAVLAVILPLTFVALGVVLDRLIAPPPTYIHQWAPVKLLDTDFAKLDKLTRKGDTYTRYAKTDGAWGVIAVRMPGGVWVVPCQEVAK
jgi:cobalamin biosynthesis protein CobD/CbiB